MGPEIRVLSPERGAALTLAKRVEVRYEVEDAESELDEVTINGEPVAVAQRGAGSFKVIPRPGLNLIEVEARDEHGNRSHLVQSFYAAAAYRSVAPGAGREHAVPDGLTLWLGQEALDAEGEGEASGRGGRPRDLATVVELVLASLKGDALVGKQIKVAQSGFKGSVTITGIERGPDPEVRLKVAHRSMALEATIKDVRVRVRLDGTLAGLAETRVSASVTASSVTLSGVLDIAMPPGGKVRVRTRDLESQFHGLKVSIDNSWGSAVNWLIEMFEGEVAELLARESKAQLVKLLDVPLARALDGIAVDETITVPPLGAGGPKRGVALALRSTLESLELEPARGDRPAGVRAGLRAAVSSAPANTMTAARGYPGALVRRGCGRGTPRPPAPRHAVEVGLRLDLANQLLTSLWQAGLFRATHDLTEEANGQIPLYRFDKLEVDAELSLPPLLIDCGLDRALEVQVGDVALRVRATTGGQLTEIDVFLSAAAKVLVAASGGLGGGALSLQIAPAHVLEFDVTAVRIAGEPASPTQAAMFESMLGLVSARVLEMFQGTLAVVPLPALELSAIAPDVPAGAAIAPSITFIATEAGALTVGGGVR